MKKQAARARKKVPARKTAAPARKTATTTRRKKAPSIRGSKTEPVRKITKTGTYTYYVTIPKAMIDELGWKERQKVVVEKSGETVIIRDWKK